MLNTDFLVYEMKLSEILAIENIIPELKARDKQSVLGELAEVIASYDTNIDKEALVKVLIERSIWGARESVTVLPYPMAN